MLPPRVGELLVAAGHDATTPVQLGAHNLPDEVLVGIASEQGRVIVTENAVDFAGVTSCTVLLVGKAWWPPATLSSKLATALGRWAAANAEPGPWAHWLPASMR